MPEILVGRGGGEESGLAGKITRAAAGAAAAAGGVILLLATTAGDFPAEGEDEGWRVKGEGLLPASGKLRTGLALRSETSGYRKGDPKTKVLGTKLL